MNYYYICKHGRNYIQKWQEEHQQSANAMHTTFSNIILNGINYYEMKLHTQSVHRAECLLFSGHLLAVENNI